VTHDPQIRQNAAALRKHRQKLANANSLHALRLLAKCRLCATCRNAVKRLPLSPPTSNAFPINHLQDRVISL